MPHNRDKQKAGDQPRKKENILETTFLVLPGTSLDIRQQVCSQRDTFYQCKAKCADATASFNNMNSHRLNQFYCPVDFIYKQWAIKTLVCRLLTDTTTLQQLTTQKPALTFYPDLYPLIFLPCHTLRLSLSSIHCSSRCGYVPCGKQEELRLLLLLQELNLCFKRHPNNSTPCLCNSEKMC